MKPGFFLAYLLLQSSILSSPGNCQTSSITVDDIYNRYLFYPETPQGIRSMADGERYTVLESDRSIASYDFKTGQIRNILFSMDEIPAEKRTSVDDYSLSRDEKKILLTTNSSAMYRHSFEAEFLIYDLVSKTLTPLLDTGKQQLATFSPDGMKVAFVKNNNLFFKDLANDSVFQVTTDGKLNSIINGAPDWVYEEEFGFSQAYCWSPDSRKIAFYRFDESQVKEFDMAVYGDLYPAIKRFKYPKAGEANSTVTIHVYDISSQKTLIMEAGTEVDQYIPRIKWSADPEKLAIIRLNRRQNIVEVLLADAGSGVSNILFREENPKFLSRIDDDFIHFTTDRKRFIVLSEWTGYYHYYLYDIKGNLLNAVTRGNWEVTGFKGINDKSNTLYYTSNQGSIIGSAVYSIRLDGSGQHKITETPGTNDAEFSSTYRYFINTWSDANTPPVYSLHRSDGTLIRVLNDNANLKNELKSYGFTRKEFIQIPVSHELFLNGYIIKPPDFDSTKVYPLFMYVYGGPESQDVTDSWDNGLAWQQLLAQHGIIIACVDNRGTDGRGEAFRKSTYMQLGKLETEDQINAARYLGSKSWIDENRIGIWGWSYGGYMTLLCLTKGSDVFKAGIAVAPVTNWRFYDNIYTERFMRKPQENASGYDDNSPINFAGGLKGQLMMIHGTADDNVHLQNSMEMARQFILKNKQFQQFEYPNKNHNINGGNTRFHLYTMMTAFILKNL